MALPFNKQSHGGGTVCPIFALCCSAHSRACKTKVAVPGLVQIASLSRELSLFNEPRAAEQHNMNRIESLRLVNLADAATDSHVRLRSQSAEATPEQMDIVFVENFVAPTIIGIDREEKDAAQPVRINLAIGLPRIRACTTDRIEDTVNYAAVREALLALLATHRLTLLEALAEAVAQLLIGEFGAAWVRVSIAKPAKFDDVTAVGVQIERRRSGSDAPGMSLEGFASLGAGLVPN